MEPIFNEKIVKKWYLWVREQYIQYMNTLFTVEKSTLNSSRKPPETHAKKEKKKQKKGKTTWTWIQTYSMSRGEHGSGWKIFSTNELYTCAYMFHVL